MHFVEDEYMVQALAPDASNHAFDIAVLPGRIRTDGVVTPIVLLLISNVFMTFAWYGHLKYKGQALWLVVLVSWGIAFIEYCFAVPANRWGHGTYSAAELKTMQEVITLIVFAAFSVFYLGEALKWNHAVGFALIAGGAFFVFHKW